MTGGLKEAASLMAIAALTCVMGATVFVAKPAKAADLGGDCCADLEERGTISHNPLFTATLRLLASLRAARWGLGCELGRRRDPGRHDLTKRVLVRGKNTPA